MRSKSSQDGIHVRVDMEEEKISEYEDIAIQTIHNEIQNNDLKVTTKVTELWDNFKQLYLCGTRVQEGEEV